MIPLEILIVVLILLIFLVLSLFSYINGITLLSVGLILIIIGLFFGVPVGLYYHFLLFQRRGEFGTVLKGWWISPKKYHKYLPIQDQSVLNRWFWIGAIFFNLSIAGCALVVISLFVNNRLNSP